MELNLTPEEVQAIIEKYKLEIEYLKLQIQDLMNAVASSNNFKGFGNN